MWNFGQQLLELKQVMQALLCEELDYLIDFGRFQLNVSPRANAEESRLPRCSLAVPSFGYSTNRMRR
tara:strand:+ start:158 stop:358 length:201 start_codon:yes stop_codon:yes gene_type:complete